MRQAILGRQRVGIGTGRAADDAALLIACKGMPPNQSIEIVGFGQGPFFSGDRGFFAVEGPMTDDRPWYEAAASQAEAGLVGVVFVGRGFRCPSPVSPRYPEERSGSTW